MPIKVVAVQYSYCCLACSLRSKPVDNGILRVVPFPRPSPRHRRSTATPARSFLRLLPVVRGSHSGVHSVVAEALCAAGWRLHDADADGAGQWTLQWLASRCTKKMAEEAHAWQRLNHFAGYVCLLPVDCGNTWRRHRSTSEEREFTVLTASRSIPEQHTWRGAIARARTRARTRAAACACALVIPRFHPHSHFLSRPFKHSLASVTKKDSLCRTFRRLRATYGGACQTGLPRWHHATECSCTTVLARHSHIRHCTAGFYSAQGARRV